MSLVDERVGERVWQKCEFNGNTVTDLTYSESDHLLLGSSNGGHLGVFDIRMPKLSSSHLYALSDQLEEELNCLSLLGVSLLVEKGCCLWVFGGGSVAI